MRLTIVLYIDAHCHYCGHDSEKEVIVTGTVSPFVRGRTQGLPENCYPDEGGEVEVETATLDGKPHELTDEQLAKAIESLAEKAGEDDGPLDVEPED